MEQLAEVVRLTREGALPVTADAFALDRQALPALGPGEVLVRIHYLSLDPYQRIRLRSLGPGDTPPGGALGQVLRSNDSSAPEGTWVTGELGWRDHAVTTRDALTILDPDPAIPLHHYVGMLGLSGLTAYFGTTEVLRPKKHERIVVSGAYGAVGQIAVQIARNSGAEVLGIIGSERKAKALAQLGVTSVNYRDPAWVRRLIEWAPDGVDGYFDNVWGDTSSRVVEQLRPRGRVALCGQMTGLSDGRVAPLDIDWYLILTRSITLQGFRAVDYSDRWEDARTELGRWYHRRELSQEVNMLDGLAGVAQGFEDMLNGRTTGKTTVQVR
ncbi:MAG TPA: NADP-dependent oxidoreductase [Pseudonocardia sp.]|jgi:NADPH-dependent curcumin reductase CurA